MRLKHIKLSGFKSFVDTTKIALPANLVGVVGPNGCGKSNVIDAIRWVMGESSAKTLRGDNMEDVIFNGSVSRKPVNKASVELVFDNKSGSAPGAYAKYNEISIKRELVREGGSKYFINGVKSRRKDINDIFLGTGLGPRSYSIIEQGMVSRIVESKPEELRNLIEEAAGISKYKTRRRETENRIRHTQENLSRVEDIVGELETQLRRLKRQANSAERYKNLKEELREKDQLLSITKWAELDERVAKQVQDVTRLETELEKHVSEQRSMETNIETMRDKQIELTEDMNKVQAEYYQLGGEVTALEQKIRSVKESRETQKNELQRLQSSQNEAQQHLVSDEKRLEEAVHSLNEIEPHGQELAEAYQESLTIFNDSEQQYAVWQSEWEQLAEEATEPEKERGVQAAQVDNFRRSIEVAVERQSRAQGLLTEIESNIDVNQIETQKQQADLARSEAEQQEEKLTYLDEKITTQRADIERLRDSYNSVRHRLQGDSARLSSLQEMRQHLLGNDDELLQKWLEASGLQDSTRLLDELKVDAGWESAVEFLLAGRMTAIKVDSINELANEFDTTKQFALSTYSTDKKLPKLQKSKYPLLLEKINSAVNLLPWLSDVFAANSLNEALSWQSDLAANELVVTPEGELIGANWFSIGSDVQNDKSLLKQEAEIELLLKSVKKNEIEVAALKERGEAKNIELSTLEEGRQSLRAMHREQSQKSQELQREYARTEAKNSEWINRREQLTIELTELTQELISNEKGLLDSQDRLATATESAKTLDQRRAKLSQQRNGLRDALDKSRISEQVARERMQEQQVQQQGLMNTKSSLEESIIRLRRQLELQIERAEELKVVLTDEDPSVGLSDELKTLLDKRIAVEKELTIKRNALSEHEVSMRQTSEKRSSFDSQAQTVRSSLEQLRIQQKELMVRRDTFSEQLGLTEDATRELAKKLPENANIGDYENQIESLRNKIDRIGPVNLVAIEEFEECSERAGYLTNQREDLLKALETLVAAINKIDRETRSRFKETFEALNAGFKDFFPKLFGDGEAHLVLTDNDMLTTGVGVMARPPGKRNSTIHLLSGGEKALTAVALIFAFFELNPAPFCVLDEVDAPLDDANVERYSNVLRKLGEKTQLLFITHNKITMESANVLVGVTMAEPGSSRIVQVDVEEAAAMAAD